MKKSILLIIMIIVASLFSFGCKSEEIVSEPYEGFDGVDPTQVMEIDDFVTIDGVLDEDFWADKATEFYVEGKDVTPAGNPIDLEKYGERAMTVYTYIGEKAVYFAFDVQDKFMMYNPDRNQGGNTGVEIYLTSDEHHRMEVGCVSVRVTPTGDGNEVFMTTYVPRSTDDEWKLGPSRGTTLASAVVDGNMMTKKNRNPDMSENKGYTVELAVDWSLIATRKPEAIQFTAAFCQAGGWEPQASRIGWGLFPGTGYCSPASWYLVSNEQGKIDDKPAFFDAGVEKEKDEAVTIDGVLDEEFWSDTLPRTIVTNKTRKTANGGEPIELSFYNKNTEKGVYIGLKSNDDEVWFHEDASVAANACTGAEIMIATNKATRVNPNTVVQYRFNVGGRKNRQRWYGDPYKELPYVECYFPALSAGKVLGGEINTSSADGWTGEIFIPWRVFGLDENDYRDGVAIMPCMYRGFSNSGQRNYCAPTSQDVWGNGSKLVNPQKRWFLFEDGKPVYKLKEVKDLYLTRDDLNGENYEAKVMLNLSDDVITTAGYSEGNAPSPAFDVNLDGAPTGVTKTANNDGSVTIKIPSQVISQFDGGKSFSVTANDLSVPFNIYYDGDYLIDGIFDESVYPSLKKFTDTQASYGHNCVTEFTVSFGGDALYLFTKIADDGYTDNNQAINLGLELYFNYGETLDSLNTRQVRLRSKDGNQVRLYLENVTSYPWDGGYASADIIQAFHDNNDGTYNLEAKIPYFELGLDEKPQWLEILPVTYYHNGSSTTPRVSFLNNGNTTQLSNNKNYYLGFTEDGYAHNKVIVKGFDDVEKTSEISVLDTKEDIYTGTFTLGVVPDNRLPLTGATFNQFVTEISNGKYSYAIPKTAFIDGECKLNLTSAHYTGSVSVKLVAVSEISMEEETPLYDFEKSGDNFVKRFNVFANGGVALPNVTFSGELASKITPSSRAGEYKLTLTKAEASAITQPITITASFNGMQASTKVYNYAVASSVKEDATYASGSAVSSVKKSFAIGTSSFTAGCNLSIPSSFTGNAMTLRDVFSTSSNRGGGTGFRISFKKENGKYQLCVQNNGIFSNTAQWYDLGTNFEYVGKTIAFVIEVDRTTATTFKLNIYFNGKKIAVGSNNGYTDTFTVAETFVPQSATDANVIFGYGGWDGNNDSNSALKGSNGWTVSDIIINKSLCASALSNELMARQ